MPEFITSAKELISGIIRGVSEFRQRAIDTFINLIKSAVSDIKKKVTDFIDAAKSLVNGIISGISETGSSVSDKFGEIISSAVTSIKSKVSDFINAGKDLVAGFIQGISDGNQGASNAGASLGSSSVSGLRSSKGINSHSPAKKTIEAGEDYVEGYDIGIENGYEDAYHAGEGLGDRSVSGLIDALTNASFEHLDGRYLNYGSHIAEGFATGISGGSSYVERSAQMLSEAIRNTLDIVEDIAENDIGIHPVVTPILDLSDLKSKANTIGTLFPGQSLALASSIGIGRVQNGESPEQAVVDGGTQINFTQNNYSPKELSRYEIYRQTKNQLNMMKGVVKANA